MSRGSTGTILKYGLILGGGYWLYSKFKSGEFSNILAANGGGSNLVESGFQQAVPAQTAAQSNAAPISSAPAPPPPATPSPAPTVWPVPAAGAAASLVDRLNEAAQGNAFFTTNAAGELVAPSFDHWNFYRNQLEPPELTGAEFDAAVRASGLPGRGDNATAQQFVDALTAARVGISGLGAVVIPLPILTRDASGHKTIIWAGQRTRGA